MIRATDPERCVQSAWLMLAAGANRQHAGNAGYPDDPERHYVWDSTVANHKAPKRGDVIVLWDTNVLLGMSVIDWVHREQGTKERFRCPRCGETGIKTRLTKKPRFRCAKASCRLEFDEPNVECIEVEVFRTDHAAAWIDLYGMLGSEQLRNLCEHTKSIQSLRRMDLSRLQSEMNLLGAATLLEAVIVPRQMTLQGTGPQQSVRAQMGKGQRRAELIRRHGAFCALTGPQPVEVLDAVILCSFATTGRSHEHAALLVRRDVLPLLDIGLLAIDPESLAIDVSPRLRDCPDYLGLDGRRIAAKLDSDTRLWLAAHWHQHRGRTHATHGATD